MKRAWALVAAASVLLAVPAAAQAKARQYVLRHPTRERCKAHYLRKNRLAKVHRKYVRQVWCVRAAPKSSTTAPPKPGPTSTPTATPGAQTLTPTFTTVSTLEGGGRVLEQPSYKTVSASVDTYAPGPGSGVAGVPVVITLADPVTGHVLARFTETSTGGSCAIAIGLAGGFWVLTGEAVASYPGCPISTINVPASGNSVQIMGSFAGNGQYAASASKWEPFL
jgi:hypothetical protein